MVVWWGDGMGWWVRVVLLVYFLMKIIACVLDAMYRIYTKRDKEVSWEVEALGDLIIMWLYLFFILALWLGW